jgi:hypothetical protein
MYGTSCATSAAGDDITETQVAIRWPTGIPLFTYIIEPEQNQDLNDSQLG